MCARRFKKIYTRTTGAQDVELYIVHPTFSLPNTPVTEAVYIGKDGKWEAWYPEDEYMNLMNKYADLVMSAEWNLETHLERFQRDRDHLVNVTRQLVDSVAQDFNPKQASDAYRKYCDAWLPYIEYIWLPWAITFVLDERFHTQLLERYGEEKGQALYEALAVCTQPIQMDRCVEALLEWKLNAGSPVQLQRIQQQFGHLGGYSVNDRCWTTDELEELIREYSDPHEELKKKRRVREEALRRAEDALALLQKDDLSLWQLARTIHKYVFLRTERIDIYKWAAVHAGPFFRAFERYFDLPTFTGGHLTQREVVDIFTSRKLPTSEKIDERLKQNYVVHFTRSDTCIITDKKEMTQCIKTVIAFQDDARQKNFVQGKIACKGMVTGRVKIISHANDVREMQHGEVLVAAMTHPDHMPAIRKAAAIVTDEGGIVCHAAIISRELRIPCVIGTGEATQIFQTGDMVVVDATTGVVRKVI